MPAAVVGRCGNALGRQGFGGCGCPMRSLRSGESLSSLAHASAAVACRRAARRSGCADARAYRHAPQRQTGQKRRTHAPASRPPRQSRRTAMAAAAAAAGAPRTGRPGCGWGTAMAATGSGARSRGPGSEVAAARPHPPWSAAPESAQTCLEGATPCARGALRGRAGCAAAAARSAAQGTASEAGRGADPQGCSGWRRGRRRPSRSCYCLVGSPQGAAAADGSDGRRASRGHAPWRAWAGAEARRSCQISPAWWR